MIGIGLGIPGTARRLAAPFTPASLSSQLCWLRADLGVTNPSGVSAWANQYATTPDRDYAQSVAGSRPTYTASSAPFNSLPIIGNANTRYLYPTAGDFDDLHGGGDFSLYLVGRFTDDGANWLGSSIPSSGTQKGVALIRAGGTLRVLVGNGVAAVLNQNNGLSLTTTDAYIVRWVFTPGSATKSKLRVTRSGGIDTEVTTASLLASPIAGASATPLGLFASGGGAYPAIWDCAEMIVVSAALSVGDDANVMAYLRARYAL